MHPMPLDLTAASAAQECRAMAHQESEGASGGQVEHN
jgi:hypothetical protein